MGECGCGDFHPSAAYRIGNNQILAVELYPGCQDCETGIVVSLHVFSEEDAKNWIPDEMIKDFVPDRLGLMSEHFPIIGQEDIVKWAQENATRENGIPISDYENLADYLEDFGLEILQGGFWNRQEEQRKSI